LAAKIEAKKVMKEKQAEDEQKEAAKLKPKKKEAKPKDSLDDLLNQGLSAGKKKKRT